MSRMVDVSFSANRVTPGSKVRLGLSVDTLEAEIRASRTTTITGTTSSRQASGLYVKSLGEHWSAGVSFEVESSLYSNIDLGLERRPGRRIQFLPLLPVDPATAPGPLHAWP